MKVVTAQEMRVLERQFQTQGGSTDALMESAGLVVAQEIKGFLRGVYGVPLTILVGSGNNGGDGLVSARHLQRWGSRVTIYLCSGRPVRDSKLALAQQSGCLIIEGTKDQDRMALQHTLTASRVVVDAVLGTGRVRPLKGPLQDIFTCLQEVRRINQELYVVAIDLPTGLDPNGGPTDPLCPVADLTLTLGCPKAGLFTPKGVLHAGRWKVVDIGIPNDITDTLPITLLTPELVSSLLPCRPIDAHKRTFGRVLVVAGSRPYVGAPYLASMGAYRAGAGLVTLAAPESLHPILAGKLTEVTHLPLPEGTPGIISEEAAVFVTEQLKRCQAAVIGCGLTQEPSALRFLQQLLNRDLPIPIVLDADALNSLPQISQWWESLKGQAILTPHVGEMARLLDRPIADIQAHRLDVAIEAASKWKSVVVLKGAFTIVASPSGSASISPYANPALASGGTGDILAGVIGGLVAQGLPAFEAANCGVYIHGAAGEEVRQDLGDAGMIASDLLPMVPRVLKKLRGGYPPHCKSTKGGG